MSRLKTLQSEIKKKYYLYVKVGIICSLIFLIILFKFAPAASPADKQPSDSGDIFDVVPEINTTQDRPAEPPPVQPPIVIAAAIDDPLQEFIIQSSEIDLNANLSKPPILDHKVYVDDNYEFVKFPEVLPEPVGGMKSINNKIIYPELAIKIGLESRVLVEAFISEKGDVVKAEVINEVPEIFIKEAVNAVMETKFIPGKQGNKAVKVRVIIPVKFDLN